MPRQKKDSAIVLRDLETRLTIPHDEPIIIKPVKDQIQNKKYFEDRIKELQDSNRKLKDALNSLSDKKDELKYLQEFRAMFLGHCIIHNVRKTVIQCTVSIRKGNCTFNDQCVERKKWEKLLSI